MSTFTDRQERSAGRAARVFSRVLVGVDGSEAGLEAARQAARLAEGPLTLVAVYSPAPRAVVAPMGIGPAFSDDEGEREAAEAALAAALREIEGVRPATGTVAPGSAWDELVLAAESGQATLVAVGSHGTNRGAGIVFGSTATAVVHKAPCSVLVARGTPTGPPKRIVVGVDGSPESLAALEVARHLAARHEAAVWPVMAHGGGADVDRDTLWRLLGHHFEDSPAEPVRALVTASAEADLVVVGSRGLHGLKALGSVSERTAHQALCSVLVVRGD